MNRFSVIILAAGKGTRMKSVLPKPLHQIAHKPMLGYVIDAYRAAGACEIVVVISPDDAKTPAMFPGIKTVIQTEQKGTGHAALIGLDGLSQPVDKIIMALGDMPFIRLESITALARCDGAVTVLAATYEDPAKYGRLIMEHSMLEKIVEYKDATEAERAVKLCNSGTIALHGGKARQLLQAITPQNAAGEFYATDVVAIARAKGEKCAVVEAETRETSAANTRGELAVLECIVQGELRNAAMTNGATLLDPTSVYFSHDTIIGRDAIIEPHVFFGPGVVVGNDVHIKAFCHLEKTTLEDHVTIGPFARLRPETTVKSGAQLGNFVEIKKSTIGEGSKIGHLSYIGDAVVGKDVNVGGGTITSNYNGFIKSETVIGDGAFVGAHTTIVAPVNIGTNAMTAAGSVITHDVASGALAIARARQEDKPGWTEPFRSRQQALKDKK